MLDARLALAASLVPPCSHGADIGTDHALLPAYLLEQGVCRRMTLTDISEKALARAREEIGRRGLSDRVRFLCTDGLTGLEEPCQAISVTGMGGRTIAGILLSGADKLAGATLILCAHTEQPEVRLALQAIHYTLLREEPCVCNGHAYLVWQAVPGDMWLSPREIRLGSLVFRSRSPMLRPYLESRIDVAARKLRGLLMASTPDDAAIETVRTDLAFLCDRLKETAP